MKKFLTLLGLFFVFSLAAFAQVSKGGLPSGYKFFAHWNAAPLKAMPPLNIAQLIAEDAIPDPEMRKPIRFGFAQFTSLTPANSGIWRTLPNSNKLWQLRVKSAGAFTLSLGFRNMDLPRGSRLFIYNRNHDYLLGAFTYDLTYIDGILATEQVTGDEVMIEYETPVVAAQQVPFELYRISHDYRDINKILKGFGNSGSCQVNVNCPAGAPYQTVKRGVGAIISSGSGLCSGTLVNTTNNSGTPYFLTANHCYDNNPSNWVFRFNWEAAGCANPATSPSFQSVSGATLRAKNSYSDFCLVEMSTAPPPNYNIVYDGWNKSGVAATSTAGISHPWLDIKKIAIAPSIVTSNITSTLESWQTGTWTTACTEPGSSGSALFDQNLRIVGQLYGGPSACGAPPSSMYDYYGKFSASWNGAGTPATRLKDWLDPGNTNIDTVNLYDPNQPVLPYNAQMVDFLAPDTLSCSASAQPRIILRNKGTVPLTSLFISYKIDNSAATNYSWTGNLASDAYDTVLLPAYTTTYASHIIIAYSYLPNGMPDGNVTNDTISRTFSTINPAPQPLPLAQSFEGTIFPPAGWAVNDGNADGYTWVRTSAAAYAGSYSATKDNFGSNDIGVIDDLTTPYMDFADTNYSYQLGFRVAYARYDSNFRDSLNIAVSGACSGSWQSVYAKGNLTLATAPDQTTAFVPTIANWRLDTVDLTPLRGTASAQIRFSNISGYGNVLYLDSIRISHAILPPVAAFTLPSLSVCAGQNIQLTNNSVRESSLLWAMPGATPSSSTALSPNIIFAAPGTYVIFLTVSNSSGTSTTSQSIVVNAVPTPAVVQNGQTFSVGASYASYQWYLDGAAIPGATGQSYTAATTGHYSVMVTDANGCIGQSVAIGLGVGAVVPASALAIVPNPAQGQVMVYENMTGTGSAALLIYNAIGQPVKSQELQSGANTLNIATLPAGIYTVKIRKGEVVVVQKLLVR